MSYNEFYIFLQSNKVVMLQITFSPPSNEVLSIECCITFNSNEWIFFFFFVNTKLNIPSMPKTNATGPCSTCAFPATSSAAIFLTDWKRTDQPEDINPLATSVRAAGLQSKSTMHNSKCRQQCQATIKEKKKL